MFEAGGSLDVIGARGPREVVDVFLIVAVGGGVVAVIPPLALHPGRADDPPFGNGHPDVVNPVVGKKLGAGVKLVAVPSRVLEYAELRKPLRDEEEVADR